MRTTPAAAAAAAVLLAGLPAAAAAAPATTLNGTWTRATEQTPEGTCALTPDVGGRWSVTLRKDGSATVSLQLLIHGRLHAAWGGQALGPRATWERTGTGYVLTAPLYTFTIDGDHATFFVEDRYPGCTPSPDGYVHGTVR